MVRLAPVISLYCTYSKVPFCRFAPVKSTIQYDAIDATPCRFAFCMLTRSNDAAGYDDPSIAVRRSTPVMMESAIVAPVKFVRVRLAPTQLVFHRYAPVKLVSVRLALRKSTPLRLNQLKSNPCKSHPTRLLNCSRALQSLLGTGVGVSVLVDVLVTVRVCVGVLVCVRVQTVRVRAWGRECASALC